MFSIDRDLLHTNNYLVYNNGQYSWNQTPQGMLFSNNILGHKANSIEPLLNIYGFEFAELVEEKYIKMAKQLNLQTPNWNGIIGQSFKDNLKASISQIVEFWQTIYTKPYIDLYKTTNEWIWQLKPAPLNRLVYNGLRSAEENFKLPIKDEMINPVRYCRNKIKTGRLSVISGPQVMNMAKEKRSVLKNCYSIDFASMEPTLLLNLMDMKVDGDIYEWVAKKCNLNGDRSYWKVAVISSIYGSRSVSEVNKLFALDEWIKQVESEIYIDVWGREVIENYFGRPIVTEGAREHHLLNLWLQSSANEFALKGFSEFFGNESDLNPHWLIHDSCIYSQKNEVNIPHELIIEGKSFRIHKEMI